MGSSLRALCACLLAGSFVCSCERDPRSGARIAEPEEGPWLRLCSVRVTGPGYAERSASATAVAGNRREARRRAVDEGCSGANGGETCLKLQAGWQVANETCREVTGGHGGKSRSGVPAGSAPAASGEAGDRGAAEDMGEGARSFECRVEVRRDAGTPNRDAQAEGQTTEEACERARREACEALGAPATCLRMESGWREARSLGRRRR